MVYATMHSMHNACTTRMPGEAPGTIVRRDAGDGGRMLQSRCRRAARLTGHGAPRPPDRERRPGQYPPSWYAATADLLPPFPALAGEEAADVCVVGGGYTGLSAALHLAEAGIGWCCSRRSGWAGAPRGGTAGRSGRGSGGTRTGWRRAFGAGARAGALGHGRGGEGAGAGAGGAARHRLRPAAGRRLTPPAGPGEVAELHAEAEKLARDYGYGAIEPLDRAGIEAIARHRAPITAGVLDRGAAHLHPLNYALGLARAAAAAGARIFEASRASRGGAGRGADGAGAGAGALRGGGGQRLSRRAGAGGGGAGDADQQLHRRDRAARARRGRGR